MYVIILRLVIVISIIISYSSDICAFDNKDVHPKINNHAGDQSTLHDYLKNNLGFSDGIKTQFDGKHNVTYYLEKGGEVEDRLIRPFNHFHDPLQSLESAGLSWPTGGRSSSCLIWAQNYDPDDETSNQEDWFEARTAFYDALITGSEEK